MWRPASSETIADRNELSGHPAKKKAYEPAMAWQAPRFTCAR